MKSTRKIGQSFVLFVLLTSLFSFSAYDVQAVDLSSSSIIHPVNTLALQEITITVHADGTLGDVSGATVNISCTDGEFVSFSSKWEEGTTDANGLVHFDWEAPDTADEFTTLNVTFTADITSGSDNTVIQSEIVVNPIDFDLSTVEINPTTIYELHNSSIAVTANSSLNQIIEGAFVELTCDEGYFTDTKTATTTLTTNAWGWILIYWEANLSVVISSPLVVNFTIFISYTGKIANITLTDTITVNPMDFDSSTLEVSASTVGGAYPVTITARAVGAYGAVPYAEVFLDALDGEFSNGLTNITGIADYNGYLIEEWIAPEVSSDVNITITAIFRFPTTILYKELNITILVSAFNHDFEEIVWDVTTTTVTAGDTVHLKITTTNEIGQFIANANATFVAPDGVFTSSGIDTIEVITDANGFAEAYWETASISPPIGGLDYLIEVTLIREYYNTNTSNISIHVNPVTLQLETDSFADPTDITQGAEVTITVHVTANSANIEGASVQITAQSGVFESSSTEIAVNNTNASGIATFTWITADMVLTTARDFEFSIQASLPGYEVSDVETILVHVDPVGTSPTSPPFGGLEQGELIGIIAAAAGGLLLIGVIGYFILRKKPVG